MKLSVINNDATLYSAEEIFSTDLVKKLDSLEWNTLPRTNADINRLNLILPPELTDEIKNFVQVSIIPQIESVAKVKFKSTNFSISFWLNEAGYRSRIHTDGVIPATMQIYWSPTDSNDFGTWFYNSLNLKDVLHYFPNVKNTGYVSLPRISEKLLWHGTKSPLPENIFRLSFMIVLDDFESYR